jgi:hypothetical protein
LQLAWALALACLGAFVVLSQSRGAALALVATVMMAPLWFAPQQRVFALWRSCHRLAFYLMYELIAQRGSSYRPESSRRPCR